MIMDELLEILQDVNDDVDFENCETLIDDGMIIPENFNSAKALLKMVERLQNE